MANRRGTRPGAAGRRKTASSGQSSRPGWVAPTNATAERCVGIDHRRRHGGLTQEGWYREPRRCSPLQPAGNCRRAASRRRREPEGRHHDRSIVRGRPEPVIRPIHAIDGRAQTEPTYLRPVPPAPEPVEPEQEEYPTLSLGGSTATTLKIFTLSSRLRGRSLVEDTDLTPDEIGDVLDTATRLKRMHKRGEPHTLSVRQDARNDLPAPEHPHPGFVRGGHGAARRARALSRHERSPTPARRDDRRHRQVLSRYVDAIVARVAKHQDIEDLVDERHRVRSSTGSRTNATRRRRWPTC